MISNHTQLCTAIYENQNLKVNQNLQQAEGEWPEVVTVNLVSQNR